MRVLLDECVPRGLKRLLPGHEVVTVPEEHDEKKTGARKLSAIRGQYPQTDLVLMTHKRFKQIAEQLLAELPAPIREKLGKVAIIVEDDPPPEDADLMGLFVGEPYGEGDPMVPNQIILYKNNIEAECEFEEDVPEEIRITLLHEIGHYLGLDEDELSDRGLE